MLLFGMLDLWLKAGWTLLTCTQAFFLVQVVVISEHLCEGLSICRGSGFQNLQAQELISS